MLNTNLKDKDWFNSLLNFVDECYIVGGFVRDYFLNLESKDIDLLVTGRTLNEIQNHLKPFGCSKLTSSGSDFNLVLFTDLDGNNFDISLPRNNGTILDDLKDRDFTINSIGFDCKTEKFKDPNNGILDIFNKTIQVVHKNVFIQDEIRILRLIQFLDRFNFKTDSNTYLLAIECLKNKPFENISNERILEELNKWFTKGKKTSNSWTLFILLGLDQHLFDVKLDLKINYNDLKMSNIIDSLIEIFYHSNSIDKLEDIVRKYYNIHTTSKSIQKIKAFIRLLDFNKTTSYLERSNIIKDSVRILKDENLLSIKRLLSIIPKYAMIFEHCKQIPLSVKDLNVNGYDLMKLGFKGSDISKMFEQLLNDVYSWRVVNHKDLLIQHIKNNYI